MLSGGSSSDSQYNSSELEDTGSASGVRRSSRQRSRRARRSSRDRSSRRTVTSSSSAAASRTARHSARTRARDSGQRLGTGATSDGESRIEYDEGYSLSEARAKRLAARLQARESASGGGSSSGRTSGVTSSRRRRRPSRKARSSYNRSLYEHDEEDVEEDVDSSDVPLMLDSEADDSSVKGESEEDEASHYRGKGKGKANGSQLPSGTSWHVRDVFDTSMAAEDWTPATATASTASTAGAGATVNTAGADTASATAGDATITDTTAGDTIDAAADTTAEVDGVSGDAETQDSCDNMLDTQSISDVIMEVVDSTHSTDVDVVKLATISEETGESTVHTDDDNVAAVSTGDVVDALVIDSDNSVAVSATGEITAGTTTTTADTDDADGGVVLDFTTADSDSEQQQQLEEQPASQASTVVAAAAAAAAPLAALAAAADLDEDTEDQTTAITAATTSTAGTSTATATDQTVSTAAQLPPGVTRQPRAGLRCAFCHNGHSELTPLPGPILGLHPLVVGTTRVFVHDECAQRSPQVYEHAGEWWNIAVEVKRGRGIQCAGCGAKGATVGCHVRSCKKSYHCACAVATGWDCSTTTSSTSSTSNAVAFYCTAHRPKVKTSGSVSRRSGGNSSSNKKAGSSSRGRQSGSAGRTSTSLEGYGDTPLHSHVPHFLGPRVDRDWLLKDACSEQGAVYAPQIGDTVVYFPQGHCAQLEMYPQNTTPPWRVTGGHVAVCTVKELKYGFPSAGECADCG
jgi:PHD-like zinc-binding domain